MVKLTYKSTNIRLRPNKNWPVKLTMRVGESLIFTAIKLF